MGLGDEQARIVERAKAGIDVAGIADVVARVVLGRGVERREPECVDSEGGEVGQSRDHAGEVTFAIAVQPAVHERKLEHANYVRVVHALVADASGETANAEQQWIWRGRTASVRVNARDGGRTAKAIVSGKRSSMIVRPHGGIPRQE